MCYPAPPPAAGAWGSPVELERKRRINVAVWAYAYEVLHESIVSDSEFDAECMKVDLNMDTGNAEMDAWFRHNFQPYTGSWVNKHPYKERLKQQAKARINDKRALQIRSRPTEVVGGMFVE